MVGALGLRARPNRRDLLEAQLAQHPPGSVLRARIADGQPHSDATDLFVLAWTIGAALLGALVAAIGVVINRVLR